MIAALLPFLAAAVDLFASAAAAGGSRSPPRSAATAAASASGCSPARSSTCSGSSAPGPAGARPLAPELEVAGSWPVAGTRHARRPALLGWLVARERLLPRRGVAPEEELAGYTAALLVLGVLALVVVATNAFALLFLLPSLHAWLWLPQVRDRPPGCGSAFSAGLAGPLLLLGSFAVRYGLGLDAPWYLATLVAVGYVEAPAVVVFLAWVAAAAQLTALAVGRYAPYPTAAERPPRGPLRELVRRTVLAVRGRRRLRVVEAPPEAAEA